MKKIITLALSLVLVFAMSITAFASTKADIILALKEAGANAYVSQAEQFLADNDLTETQIDGVIAEIKKAQATADGVTDISQLTAAQKQAIVANVDAAAAIVDAVAVVDWNDNTITITKGNSDYVVEAAPIKPTGASTTATVAVIAVLALGLAACGAAVSKKRLA